MVIVFGVATLTNYASDAVKCELESKLESTKGQVISKEDAAWVRRSCQVQFISTFFASLQFMFYPSGIGNFGFQ